MKLIASAAVFIGLGLLLVILSFSWQAIVPDDMIWTEEEAAAHQKASLKFHGNQFDDSISKIELAKSQQEFEALDQKLQGAKQAKYGTPFYLRWSGIVSIGVGVFLLLLKRDQFA